MWDAHIQWIPYEEIENSEPGSQVCTFSEVLVFRGHLTPRTTESRGSAAEGHGLFSLGPGQPRDGLRGACPVQE